MSVSGLSIVFRCDASTMIGSGHVMRCVTLAERFKERGLQSVFVTKRFKGNLDTFISQKGYRVISLSEEADASGTAEIVKGNGVDNISLLVIDQYGLDADWEEEFRAALHVRRTLVIDDLANRKHVCDYLLDQNYYPDAEARYTMLLPKSCRRFLGPQYALLRREFYKVQVKERSVDTDLNVLVFFGGGEDRNLTSLVIDAFECVEFAKLHFHVVVGSMNSSLHQLRSRINPLPNFHLYVQVDRMAELMSEMDYFIGSGGTITWERGLMGLPSMVVSVASNQIEMNQAISDEGFILYMGSWQDISSDALRNGFRRLLRDGNIDTEGLQMMVARDTAAMLDEICEGLNVTEKY